MNSIPNRKAVCDVLMSLAQSDKNIVVLCSDSRGSGSVAPFADAYPEQFVEVGIAEQNIVSIAAGLAACGKRPFVISPASFLTARAYEQIKVDCVYSDMNVKLIGISGGVSYGALGMSHHSAQDIAAVSALPNIRVYLPSDRFQTAQLIERIASENKPAYVRIGRNPVEDVYAPDDICIRKNDKANVLRQGKDAVIVSCGELLIHAVRAAELLEGLGIDTTVIDMYCLKPADEETLLQYTQEAKAVVSVEEHSPWGGLGSEVARILGEKCPRKMRCLSLPDSPVITGTSSQVFNYYGLNSEGIAEAVKEMIR